MHILPLLISFFTYGNYFCEIREKYTFIYNRLCRNKILKRNISEHIGFGITELFNDAF